MSYTTPQQTVQIDQQGRTRPADTVNVKSGPRSVNFGDVQAAAAASSAPATYFVAKHLDGAPDPQVTHSSVVSATLNNVAGAPYGYGAPYMGGPQASTNQFGVGQPGGNVGAPGAPGTPAGGNLAAGVGLSQDYYEKRAILTQMQDQNWQFLLLQNDVQNMSRQFTIISNMSMVRHQVDMNIARNTGRAQG